jgi:hypothetical protein
MLPDHPRLYRAPASLSLNQWGLSGTWNVGAEQATSVSARGRVVFRFHARDLHLVLGPAATNTPIRFKVRLDGAAPGADHGVDVDSAGSGTVTSYRLYQLIRQHGTIGDHTFEIEFLDEGVEVFAFTFG